MEDENIQPMGIGISFNTNTGKTEETPKEELVQKEEEGLSPATTTLPEPPIISLPENQELNVDNMISRIPKLEPGRGVTSEAQVLDMRQKAEAMEKKGVTYTDESLKRDENWNEASAIIAEKFMPGEGMFKTQQELAEWGITFMRKFDSNMVSTVDTAFGMNESTPEEKAALAFMIEAFEAKEGTWAGALEQTGYMAADPTNIISLGTLGVGLAGKWGVKEAAKMTLKDKLMHGAILGAIDTAPFVVADTYARQKTDINTDKREGYDHLEAGVNTAVGTTIGAMFGSTLAAGGHYVSKWFNEAPEAMAQAAGGGAPPMVLDIEPAPAKLVIAASQGDKDAVDEVANNVFGRTFEQIANKNTDDQLKPMLLNKLQENPTMIEDLAEKYGYKFKYFTSDPNSIGKSIGKGVLQERPANRQKFKKDGYGAGNIWVYDPTDSHGAFNDPEYTKSWREVHELAHAITERIMEAKYGESRRFGAMGNPTKNPYDPTDPRVYQPLTLEKAQRAIEWEDVAFRTQVKLLKDMGIKIDETQAANDFNIAGSDTVIRVLTGDFSDPGNYGVVPRADDYKISTKSILELLENQEGVIAKEQGREPTAGINLQTWKPISDAELDVTIKQGQESPLMSPVGENETKISIEAVPGETVNKDLKETIQKLPAVEQSKYMKDMYGALADNAGYSTVAKKIGLEVGEFTPLNGVWNGEVSPSAQISVIPEYDNAGNLTPEFIEKMDAMADVYRAAFQQDGVGWHSPKYKDGAIGDYPGIEVSTGKPLTTKQTKALEAAVNNEMGGGDVALVSTKEGVRILNVGDTDNQIYRARVMAALDKVDLPELDVSHFDFEGGMAMGGEDAGLLTGRTDLQGWFDENIKPQVDRVNERYTNKDAAAVQKPKPPLALPAPGKKVNKKERIKELTAKMKGAKGAEKDALIQELKMLNTKPKKVKTEKVKELVKVQEEFNDQFYSKLDNELEKAIEQGKTFKDRKALEDHLLKNGVKKDELKAAGFEDTLEQNLKVHNRDLEDLKTKRKDKIAKEVYSGDSDNFGEMLAEDVEGYTLFEDAVNVSVGEAGYGERYSDPRGGYWEIGMHYDDEVYVDDAGYEYDYSSMGEDWFDNYYDGESYRDEMIDAGVDMDDAVEVRTNAIALAQDDSVMYDHYNSKQVWQLENGSVYDDLDDAREALFEIAADDINAERAYDGEVPYENYTIGGGESYSMDVYHIPEFDIGNLDRANEPHLSVEGLDSENVQLHVRSKVRVDDEGRSGTVLEEVQSQWEQDWRASGGDTPPNPTQLKKAEASLEETKGKLEQVSARMKIVEDKADAAQVEHEIAKQLMVETDADSPDKPKTRIAREKAFQKLNAINAELATMRKNLKNPLLEKVDKLRKITEWQPSSMAAPPIQKRSQYTKVGVMDKMLESVQGGEEYFGWINAHIQNGEVHPTEQGMANAYDIEIPAMVKKQTGKTPYMASFETGEPITMEGGQKIEWNPENLKPKPKRQNQLPGFEEETLNEDLSHLEYYDDLARTRNDDAGTGWYWRIDYDESLIKKLKAAKIEMYGVGGISIAGAATQGGSDERE